MQFKVKNVSVKVSFSFLALILLLLVTGRLNLYLITILCATIHEVTHIVFIYLFSGKISSVTLSLFGGDIKRESTFVINSYKEAIVSISAPLVNLLLSLIFYLLGDNFLLISQINFILGFINILPFFTFDGGRFLEYMLLILFSDGKTDKILTVISICTTAVFCIASAFLFIYGIKNYFTLLFSLYMIVSLLFKK